MWFYLGTVHTSSCVSFRVWFIVQKLTPGHSNIIEKRYQLTEREASIQASYLLAGSIVLYPVVSGFHLLMEIV